MKESANINFILPFKPRRPAGGFRVMYEYANRLVEKGHRVHLYFPLRTKYMNYRFPYTIRNILSKVEGFRTNIWFNFHPSITMSYIPVVIDKYIQDADILIATWWTTAEAMGKLSERKGKKINLIQGYENWEGHEDELLLSYNMPNVTNVVVANYLKTIVDKHSSTPSILIPNAVDGSRFRIATPIANKRNATVSMTFSIQEIKGSKYGIEALILAKEKHPELQAELFGICPEPEGLPDWMKFYHNPKNLPNIYDRNAIFLSNSYTEGFPLTPAEALFCGSALICTNIDGHKEFAKDNVTALLVEPKNSQQMADAISFLIENPEDRIELAKRGNEHIQQYSWKESTDKMNKVILSLINKN